MDVIDGDAVTSIPRYTYEPLFKESQEAMQFVQSFFDKFLPQYRYLCGGIDVVKLSNGYWNFIEFNFGADSSYIDFESDPVNTNLFFTQLLGSPTPMIKEFLDVLNSPIENQKNFLDGLNEYFIALQITDQNIWDIAIDNVKIYFRDYYLNRFFHLPKSEQRKNKDTLYHDFEYLFKTTYSDMFYTITIEYLNQYFDSL